MRLTTSSLFCATVSIAAGWSLADNSKLRRAIDKLLAGSGRPADLATLFLGMRDHNHFRDSVKEVGDAVAHMGERDRGLTTRTSKRHAAIVAGIIPLLFKVPGHPHVLPSTVDLCAGLVAALELQPQLAAQYGMRPEVARSTLGRALKKIDGVGQDGFLIGNRLSAHERGLAQMLVRIPTYGAAFNGDGLFDDFIYVLKANKILTAAEEHAFLRYRNPVSLFAVAALNGSTMRIGTQDVRMTAVFDGGVSIIGDHPFSPGDDMEMRLGFELFNSGIAPNQALSPSFLSAPPKHFTNLEQDDDFLLRPF